MNKITQQLKSNWLYMAGAVIGSIVGYLYWLGLSYNISSCEDYSHPITNIIYGILIGASLFGLFKKDK